MSALKVVEGRAAGAEVEVVDALLIGRGGVLGDDPELSREHARVTRAARGDLIIQDLGSSNGTFVNGRRITAPEPLHSGDRISLGTTTLEVHDGDNGAPATAAEVRVEGTAVAQRPAAIAREPAATSVRPVQTPPAAARPAQTAAAPPQAAAATPQAPAAAPPQAAAATPQAAAAPPARPPAEPKARSPIGLKPPLEPERGARRARLALIAAVVLLVAGSFVLGLLLAGDEESEPPAFAAMAQGNSVAEIQPNGEAVLTIELGFIQAPYGFEELSVRKILDARDRPPFPVRDGVYTLTAANGDRLVLATEGTATAEGEPPDNFFARADETWTVTEGTGRFEGASGSGRVLSAVVLDSGGEGRSAVVKYFTGELDVGD